jgi:hypothetical protein
VLVVDTSVAPEASAVADELCGHADELVAAPLTCSEGRPVLQERQ